MPITLDGTLGVGTPGITLAGGAITASANQLNSSAEDVNSENLIINGDMSIWQRGTTTSLNAFAADRWANGFVGGTVTQSQQAFTLGDTLGVTQPRLFLRQSVSGQTLPAHYALTVQSVEGVRSYAGQTITVLGWARRSSGATGNMAVEFAQFFGAGGGGSPSVTGIGATIVTLTGAWAPFAVVVNVPSVTTKTLGATGNDTLQLFFWSSAGSNFNARTNSLGLQTIGVDLWGIHIRVGTWIAADAALYRPRDPGTELLLCQRYCQTITVSAQGPSAGSSSVPWNNKVTMRTTPNLTVTRTSIATVNASVAGDTIDGPDGGYFGILSTAPAGYVVGRQYRLDAEL